MYVNEEFKYAETHVVSVCTTSSITSQNTYLFLVHLFLM